MRGCNVGLPVKEEEKAAWKVHAKVLLAEAFSADAEEKKKTQPPSKMEQQEKRHCKLHQPMM